MTTCEFFLIRYVPDLIKNEPVNIGLVMLDSEGGNGFAGVRFASNFERVRCLDANADVEMIHALAEDIRQKLATAADRHEMLRIMQDFSNTLQISETRGCQTESPQQEIEKLAELYLESMPAIKEPRAVAAHCPTLGARPFAHLEGVCQTIPRQVVCVAAASTRLGRRAVVRRAVRGSP